MEELTLDAWRAPTENDRFPGWDAQVSLAEQYPNQANTLTVTTKVTALSVRVTPKQAATSDKVRFRGRGMPYSSMRLISVRSETPRSFAARVWLPADCSRASMTRR